MVNPRSINRNFDLQMRKLAQDPRRLYEGTRIKNDQIPTIKAVRLA